MNALTRWGVWVLLGSLPFFTGCMKPHNYYAEVTPTLNATGTGPIVIVTHDQRPYVVSGGTSPTLVGLVRAPAGIPYPAHTPSGRPLADEITESLARALSKKGFQCRPVFVPASMKPDEVRRKLQEYPEAIELVLVLREWKSDTHTDTALVYDATLSILDPSSVTLAETHIQGRDVLGEALFWNVWGGGKKFAETAVPQALQGKLETLLNIPQIITALQTGTRPSFVAQQAPKAPAGFLQLQPQYDAFRLFLQPRTDAERLSGVAAGVPLTVIEEREPWLYVETSDGKRGWILREWTRE